MTDAVEDKDESDRLPDFRLLIEAATGRKHVQHALPNRISKHTPPVPGSVSTSATSIALTSQESTISTPLPHDLIAEQFDAFYNILAEERSISEKSLSRAIYLPNLKLFKVTVLKGTHFTSMGHHLPSLESSGGKGKQQQQQQHTSTTADLFLFPEEAMFLVDRGSLLCSDQDGIEMSVQQMWNVMLLSSCSTTCLESFSGNNQQIQENDLGLEKYMVYSYLRRLGFIVIRPGTYSTSSGSSSKLSRDQQQQPGLTLSEELIYTDGASKSFWMQIVHGLFHRLTRIWNLWSNGRTGSSSSGHMFWRPWSLQSQPSSPSTIGIGIVQNFNNEPLVAFRDKKSFPEILSTIDIIPKVDLRNPALLSKYQQQQQQHCKQTAQIEVDFEIYKPVGTFKKREPRPPDYRLVVTNVNSVVPSMEAFKTILEQQQDLLIVPAQATTPASSSSSSSLLSTSSSITTPGATKTEKDGSSSSLKTESGKKTTKKRIPDPMLNILFAIVDGGQITFLNLSDVV